MAQAFLFLLLLDFRFGSGAPSPIFLSEKTADSVLRRHKRYNTGVFEEFLQGNLERECLEEKCNLEEAREIFEIDEKTMEFWAGYVDGNQCASSPCLNQGSCRDRLGLYTCTCASGFTGSNCEIVLHKRCDVNNGGCMHFCVTMGTFGAKCFCATGYKLLPDGVSCEATVDFPCGKTALTVRSPLVRSFYTPGISNPPNTPALTNTTTPTPSPTTETNSTEPDLGIDDYDYVESNHFELPSNESATPFKRIVGGRPVTAGEIPWQVGLIAYPSGLLFCGGSILSERWVITAAHCLVEVHGSFLVRVGEHNTDIKEGSEQDYEVLEEHMHPRYNASSSLYNHDITLVFLKTSISFSARVRPVCIGPMPFIETLVKQSSPATVSGWGRTRFLGSTSKILQKIEVPFVDQTECKKSSNERITPVMFCAGFYAEAKDACQGDSGGPHTNSFRGTWFLTGIVSWGEECAKDGKYGVYTRVSLYYSWIKNVIGVTKKRLALDVEYPDS